MQDTIHIGDRPVLEAHPDGLYVVLRREGEPGAVRSTSTRCATWQRRWARWRQRSRGLWLGMTSLETTRLGCCGAETMGQLSLLFTKA